MVYYCFTHIISINSIIKYKYLSCSNQCMKYYYKTIQNHYIWMGQYFFEPKTEWFCPKLLGNLPLDSSIHWLIIMFPVTRAFP